MNKTIFITGKVKNSTVSQLDEFELARQQLAELGFATVTTAADDLPMGDELNNPDAENYYMSLRNKRMQEADLVLYLSNYEDDKKSKLEVLTSSYSQRSKSIAQFIKEQKGVEA